MQKIRVFQTCRGTRDRLGEIEPLSFGSVPDYTCQWVVADPEHTFQTIEGFGGAFTESAAVTMYKMKPALQQEILRAYFDPVKGHGYTFCRTHINSCDFSLGNYACCDVPGDVELKHFNIDRERKALIPMIKSAFKIAGGKFKLFASPWSPPAWMKTTGKMNEGGELKPEYRKAWARYYCKFIKEFGKEGIPIWGITVQNEPISIVPWDSCAWTPEQERDFVRDYLGPELRRQRLSNVKLMVWDHNRNRMYERAKAILDDPKAAKYAWGVAFHWYCGDHFQNLQLVHDVWPDKKLVFSEGCVEKGPHIGEWEMGERYAYSMVNDLNRWTVAWTDWNLVLDETGGPNHVGNLCSAPIIADTKKGKLLYQSSYYYIGHFSRFIKPGAKRIACSSTVSALFTTAFLNPDSSVAVVVLNKTDDAQGFTLRCAGRGAKTQCPAHSIRTFVFNSSADCGAGA